MQAHAAASQLRQHVENMKTVSRCRVATRRQPAAREQRVTQDRAATSCSVFSPGSLRSREPRKCVGHNRNIFTQSNGFFLWFSPFSRFANYKIVPQSENNFMLICKLQTVFFDWALACGSSMQSDWREDAGSSVNVPPPPQWGRTTR